MIGATGGIGSALSRQLADAHGFEVMALSRSSDPPLDLLDEACIANAASEVSRRGTPGLIIVATGILHSAGIEPEKSWRTLDPSALGQVLAVNAIGPAIVMKHFLPLMPRDRRSVFAAISAKVGSIGDNRLGGWYAYRASKAALNQLVRTAAIELARRAPQAICVAIHPGTVATSLSDPFAKSGLEVQSADEAAAANSCRSLASRTVGQRWIFRSEREAASLVRPRCPNGAGITRRVSRTTVDT